MRINLLSPQDKIIGHIDNSGPDALHYWNDEIHETLLGTAAELTMNLDAQHELSPLIREGCKLSFIMNGKPYYMNIMEVEASETELLITAWSTTLDLILETEEPFTADEAHPVSWYINKWNWEGMLKIGINEVPEKSIKCEWTGDNTLLERYYSIANQFSAEIEFVPNIDDSGSMQDITVNIYRKHDDRYQGIGTRRSRILRYGKEITGVSRKSSISELYTAICPKGKDGLRLTSIAGREVKDGAGNVQYFVDSMGYIRAPQAMANFPSANSKSSASYARYISRKVSTDHETVEALYGYALSELKKHCVPEITYDIQGTTDANIGDTVIIDDQKFNPHLIIETRVIEQTMNLEGRVTETVYSTDFSYPDTTIGKVSSSSSSGLSTAEVAAILRGEA